MIVCCITGIIVSYTTINIQWIFHSLYSEWTALYSHIQTPHREGWVYVDPALWLVTSIYMCIPDWLKRLSISMVPGWRKRMGGLGSGGQKKQKQSTRASILNTVSQRWLTANGEGNRGKLSSDRSKKSTDREHRDNTYWRITFSDMIWLFRLIFGVIFPTGLLKLFRRLYVLSFISAVDIS